MKLIYCLSCKDVFKPDFRRKKCLCGQSAGFVTNNEAGNPITHFEGMFAVALQFKDEWFAKDSKGVDVTAIAYNKKKQILAPEIEFCTAVIEYLNQVAGTDYSTAFPTKASSMILERRREHMIDLIDFQKVIDNKWKEWKGTEYEKFMRPDTLFNKTKFAIYHGQRNGKQKTASAKGFDEFRNTVEGAIQKNNPAGSGS